MFSGRDAHVLEDRLAGRRALDPELVLELGHAEPGASFSTMKALERLASRSVIANTM
jgi:hypothetical protein